ncbi:MAG: putative endonuclease 4 [candidate division TM6 bacterium GW2011_GWE2_41_16]|nr:MAG: putative endonuclease 4 [candidate division TM6 bacterium GW2011_GWE2_41_16]
MKQLFIGAHISIAGGLALALDRAQKLGCTALQIFTHSNRQWAFKKPDTQTIKHFLDTKKITGISAVAVHTSYLLHVGSTNDALALKSQQGLLDEFDVCSDLEIAYVILHPGNGHHETEEKTAQRIAYALDQVYSSLMLLNKKFIPYLVLETTAGQGNDFGKIFEHLAAIRDHMKFKKHVRFCIDTAHIFAAGYDIHDYEKVMHQCDKILGLSNIAVIHCNDSKKELGSHVDRHEHIGKGFIGLEPFRKIINDPRLAHAYKILETPVEDGYGFKENLEVLLSLKQ